MNLFGIRKKRQPLGYKAIPLYCIAVIAIILTATAFLPSRTIIVWVNAPEGEFEPISDIFTITAYSPSINETDDTPCIGARNTNVCELHSQGEIIFASNAFPLGTTICVQGFGCGKVLDRMNKRYTDRIDVFMPTKSEAKEFGKKELEVVVL